MVVVARPPDDQARRARGRKLLLWEQIKVQNVARSLWLLVVIVDTLIPLIRSKFKEHVSFSKTINSQYQLSNYTTNNGLQTLTPIQTDESSTSLLLIEN